MDSPELDLVARHGAEAIGRWALTPGTFTLGQSRDCSIALAGEGIAEEHAVVSVDEAGQVSIEAAEHGVVVDGTSSGAACR